MAEGDESIPTTAPPGPTVQESSGKAGPVRTYQDLLEELQDLRDVQRGLDDVAAGNTVPHADVVAKLDAYLKR